MPTGDRDTKDAVRSDTRKDENYPKPLPAFQLFSISVFSFSVFSFSFYPAYISRLLPSAKADVCFIGNIASCGFRYCSGNQKIGGYFLKVSDEAGVRVSTDPLLALRE